MSNTHVEAVGPCIRRLTVEVPAEVVGSVYRDKLSELSKSLRLPGFRKGHVPPQEIQRRFGDQLRSQVIQRVIEQSYPHAVQAEKLAPVTQPVIESADMGTDSVVKYTAKFEVVPDFAPKDYRNIPLSGIPPVEANEADVDHAIEHFLEERATLEPPGADRPTRDGDQVRVDFEGRLDGQPFEGGTAKDAEILLGSGHYLPPFEAGLRGMAKGETRTFDVAFPDDYDNEQLRNRTAAFTATLKDLKERRVPKLDVDFVLSHTDYDTVEEFRADMRRRVTEARESERRHRLKQIINDKLMETNPLEVPESVVVHHAERMTRNMAYQMALIRMPEAAIKERLLSNRDRTLESARREVRLGLILAKIAENEGLTVPEADLEAEYARMGAQAGQSAAMVKAQMERNRQVAALHDRLLEEKVYDFLIANGLSRIVTA